MRHMNFKDHLTEALGIIIAFGVIGLGIVAVAALLGFGWFIAKYTFLFTAGLL